MIEHTDMPLVFDTAVNKVKYAQASPSLNACPFCDVDGLENILKIDGHKIWLKNKFATLQDTLMTVIIESDKHDGDISTYDKLENREVFRFAFDCWHELIASKKFRSVLMFKNFGPRSGGTQRHPHLQVVGLEQIDGYQEVSPENFEGVLIKQAHPDGVELTLSSKPIMGFVEFNVMIEDLKNVEKLADDVQAITKYLLHDYMNGRCDSYNLFFYHVNNRFICKVVPRFITSPYFIGYKIPQVNKKAMLEQIAAELTERLD